MIKTILNKAGISRRHFNYIMKGQRNATPATAKKLYVATGIPREIWVFGTERQRKTAMKQYSAKLDSLNQKEKLWK